MIESRVGNAYKKATPERSFSKFMRIKVVRHKLTTEMCEKKEKPLRAQHRM
jgi:hypothetical protein